MAGGVSGAVGRRAGKMNRNRSGGGGLGADPGREDLWTRPFEIFRLGLKQPNNTRARRRFQKCKKIQRDDRGRRMLVWQILKERQEVK